MNSQHDLFLTTASHSKDESGELSESIAGNLAVADGDNSETLEDDANSVSPVKVDAEEKAASGNSKSPGTADPTISGSERLPIKMLSDRILVKLDGADGDRKSSGGILIPATAEVGKRLKWAEVVAAGPSVRSMELGDRVLFNPEDRYEVEVGGKEYIILRERDVHAVAAKRLDDSHTGLYL